MDQDGLSGEGKYIEDLTWREQEVLLLLAERLTNREIANQLHLAESTVKDYVGKITSKLYAKNRRDAVERAKQLGLLEQGQKTSMRPKYTLPPERTPFIGRKNEITEIRQMLNETRLLSLIGPGGMGKTRLALKVVAGLNNEFNDGICFIPLAPIQSSTDIVQTIAESLAFPIATQADPQVQLLSFLRKRHLMLVMDNFEHLIDGVEIINQILQAAPGVKVLATSRERLNLQSETIFHVEGLAFPDQIESRDPLLFDAIALFLQSARKVRPGFTPSEEELQEIGNICQIVGGMPLAIELAAAWLHIINVKEIADELKKDFDILATEMRDAPKRHRSIRTVFDYSWSMLDPAEQEIFMLLSVFRGGFTREAAHQVAGAELLVLASFVNKSFLSYAPDSGRYEIHELLRQYAKEQLEKTQNTNISSKKAHAAYFADFMQRKWEELKGPRQMSALAEIEADIENIRAAWRYYLGQKNSDEIWKMIFGLFHLYWIRWWNHAGMELFEEAAAAFQGDEAEDAIRMRAFSTALQAYFMAYLGLAQQGYEIAQKSMNILEKLDYPKAQALAYISFGLNAYFLRRYDEENVAAEKMLAAAVEAKDKWVLGFALFARSLAVAAKDDYVKAKELANWNLNLYQEIGDVIDSAMPLIVLGHTCLVIGEFEEARNYYLRSLKISQETDFPFAIQTSSKYLSRVTVSLGMLQEAERYILLSLRVTKEIGFVRDIVNLLYEYARLEVARANNENAVKLLALVIQHPASEQSRLIEGRIRDSAQTLLDKLEAELPQDVFNAALQRGYTLELEEVTDELLGL